MPPPCSAPCWPWPGARRSANVVGVVGLAENMPSEQRAAAGRRGAQHGRQDHRGDQHRRRGPPPARRRAALHQGALQAQGDDRPRHADRCRDRGAGPRAGGPVRQRRGAGPGSAGRGRQDRASCSGGCRWARPTRSTSSRRSPTSRMSAAGARPAAPPVRCSCSSSSATCPGRISTSPAWPGPRATCRWPARVPPASACACSTSWSPSSSSPGALDRGRLLSPDPQHARGGAAAAAGEGLCRRPARAGAGQRPGAAGAAEPGLVDLRQGQRSCRTAPRATAFAEQQPIYLTIDVENPNGATILVLVDGAAAPDLAGVRPLPRPVRRRRPRGGRSGAAALARGRGSRATARSTGSRTSAAAGPGPRSGRPPAEATPSTHLSRAGPRPL